MAISVISACFKMKKALILRFRFGFVLGGEVCFSFFNGLTSRLVQLISALVFQKSVRANKHKLSFLLVIMPLIIGGMAWPDMLCFLT